MKNIPNHFANLKNVMSGIFDTDSKQNDLMRENANIDCDSSMGTMLKIGSEASKAIYLDDVLRPEHSFLHSDGWIHIHDLDFYKLTMTCCQVDLTKLFSGGFDTGHGAIREPNDIASYGSLAAVAIQSDQNEMHGGQSVPSFERDMAPGVRKSFAKIYRNRIAELIQDLMDCDEKFSESAAQKIESVCGAAALDNSVAYDVTVAHAICKLGVPDDYQNILSAVKRLRGRTEKDTEKKTHQAMEALVHNLNTMHSRAGAQVPFSSINYGTDTTPEGRMVIRNILLATEEGMGKGETPIFPVQIFKVKKGINLDPGDPNYDLFQLALRCTAKRMFPNFAFLDAPFNAKYYQPGRPETEVAYMGCRTRVIGNVYDANREQVNGRGNLSFTSINLPRLAIEANGDIGKFFAALDPILEKVAEQLLDRMEIQARRKVFNFPFLMGQGIWLDSEKLNWNDEVREVIKHGTLSIGFIGLAECLKALIGVHHGESQEAQELGLKIVKHMRQFVDQKSKEAGLNFTLLATPAEGLSGRFVKMDKQKYGILPGITDRDYYTNSSHVPVYFPISMAQKISLEAPYHELENAGHICYVEMDGDVSQNLEAMEKVVRCMAAKGIGYGAINHPIDRDPVCGFNGIIGDECPCCHRKEAEDQPFERIRRVTGYLVGTLERFNNAKRAEEQDRLKHNCR